MVAVVCVIQLDICVYLKKHGIYFNDHWSLNGITSTNHLHGHFNQKVKPVKILLMNKINLISKVNDLGTRNTWSSIDSFSKLSFIKY